MILKPKNTLRKRFIAVKSDALVIETIQTESKTHRQSRLSAPGQILILYGELKLSRDLGLTF